MTVIAVSTSGGCHAFYVSNALAVLSIFTYVSYALSARTYASTVFVTRFFGFSTLMVGLVLWFAKDLTDPGAQKGLALALLAGSIVGLVLGLVGMSGVKVIRVNGWIPVVLFVVSALGYGFMLFLKPRMKEEGVVTA